MGKELKSGWLAARASRKGQHFRAKVLQSVAALATIAVACMKGVKELMTEKVEATVERDVGDHAGEKVVV